MLPEQTEGPANHRDALQNFLHVTLALLESEKGAIVDQNEKQVVLVHYSLSLSVFVCACLLGLEVREASDFGF